MDAETRTATPDLGPVTHRVAGLLDGITDDLLDAPTPCPGYSVRDLLGHVAGLAVAFRDAARKELGPSTDTPPEAARPVLDGDWRTTLPLRLDELASAWRAPDAWQGMTQAGGISLPGQVAGAVALDEVLIHGWDLARATGQAYDADEASLRVSYELLAPAADDPGSGGMFGPPVPVPDDAPLLDRVIGLSGRHPRWRAGAREGGGGSETG
ncbi:TIGR03086 family metal-binding protein [Streptomyces sp. SP18CS02]|uniref:TIGR03086 family metal-binding protein n=1 Tax=Streptomyces sp. SP18CS02 TaxID=3002531 RepID=UPI002E768DDC|nr:TIGR03086 family metal-binding protein [Streptomyces sp. SP18CS02]MEE1753830.1 TIGR03086 family metal-binding protein [Streptomyces sp. SP18CS02]